MTSETGAFSHLCRYCGRAGVVVRRQVGEFELLICRSCGNEWYPGRVRRLLETRLQSDLTWQGLSELTTDPAGSQNDAETTPYRSCPEDDCWSCDEQPAMDDFGLCASCKVALR